MNIGVDDDWACDETGDKKLDDGDRREEMGEEAAEPHRFCRVGLDGVALNDDDDDSGDVNEGEARNGCGMIS